MIHRLYNSKKIFFCDLVMVMSVPNPLALHVPSPDELQQILMEHLTKNLYEMENLVSDTEQEEILDEFEFPERDGSWILPAEEAPFLPVGHGKPKEDCGTFRMATCCPMHPSETFKAYRHDCGRPECPKCKKWKSRGAMRIYNILHGRFKALAEVEKFARSCWHVVISPPQEFAKGMLAQGNFDALRKIVQNWFLSRPSTIEAGGVMVFHSHRLKVKCPHCGIITGFEKYERSCRKIVTHSLNPEIKYDIGCGSRIEGNPRDLGAFWKYSPHFHLLCSSFIDTADVTDGWFYRKLPQSRTFSRFEEKDEIYKSSIYRTLIYELGHAGIENRLCHRRKRGNTYWYLGSLRTTQFRVGRISRRDMALCPSCERPVRTIHRSSLRITTNGTIQLLTRAGKLHFEGGFHWQYTVRTYYIHRKRFKQK